jgi:uncharacterized membrane protein YgcG
MFCGDWKKRWQSLELSGAPCVKTFAQRTAAVFAGQLTACATRMSLQGLKLERNFMRTKNLSGYLMALTVAGAVALAMNSHAQDAASAPPTLAYGVPQVVQLAQAKISDATIIAYIKSSGSGYGLDAGQIIYLKQQGVSDAVLNAMLNQPKSSAAATSAPIANATVTSTATVAPTVTYVQTVPTTYYYAQPYYYYPDYGYYGWSPGVSVSFGWGGGWHGGGGYHGGGYHGGGGWHGHR